MLAALALLSALGGQSAPPASDIAGQYSFLREGEFLQIAVDGEKVGGIVSRLGDSDGDHGVILDHFIVTGALRGRQMTFVTAEIHAVWFEFSGRVERGPAKSRTEEGFYILQGTLKRHSSDAEHREKLESREVSFKSQPEGAAPNKPNR